MGKKRIEKRDGGKKKIKKGSGKKKRIMNKKKNKGTKRKGRRGRKQEYRIRYFTELSRTVRNLILHLLFTAARAFVIKVGIRNSKRKLRSVLFKIKG